MEFLHADNARAAGLALTHGAGGNSRGTLLTRVAEEIAACGAAVLLYDLPFRAAHSGPPRPNEAARDREGIREAATRVRELTKGPVIIAGHSYGGRQSSMLAAEDAAVADGLMLMSYPLHPPGKPESLRTEHLPRIGVPTLFIHGTSDPFGSPDEMREHTRVIPGRMRLDFIDGGGHELARGKTIDVVAKRIADAFAEHFLG